MRREDFRRRANLLICWGAWLSAIVMSLWVVGDVHRRPYGVGVVLLIGIAITASLIRSRYKLADTIAEVFKTGLHMGREDAAKKTSGRE